MVKIPDPLFIVGLVFVLILIWALCHHVYEILIKPTPTPTLEPKPMQAATPQVCYTFIYGKIIGYAMTTVAVQLPEQEGTGTELTLGLEANLAAPSYQILHKIITDHYNQHCWFKLNDNDKVVDVGMSLQPAFTWNLPIAGGWSKGAKQH